MPKKKTEKTIDPEKWILDEESVPLHFCNIVRLHADPIHANLVFGYLRPGKKEDPEAVIRVALPIVTLFELRGILDRLFKKLEENGAIELIQKPLIKKEKVRRKK